MFAFIARIRVDCLFAIDCCFGFVVYLICIVLL